MTDHKRFEDTTESQSAIVQKKRTVVRQSFPLLEFVCFFDISTHIHTHKKNIRLYFPFVPFHRWSFYWTPVCDLWIKASLVTEPGPESKSKAYVLVKIWNLRSCCELDGNGIGKIRTCFSVGRPFPGCGLEETGQFCRFSPKLPHVHLRFYCTLNHNSFVGKELLCPSRLLVLLTYFSSRHIV